MAKEISKAFAAALILSCLFSWIYIFHSNTNLAAEIAKLKAEGHLVVPNGHALDLLSSAITAFWGSLFFVLTAGVMVAEASIISWLLIFKMITRRNGALISYLAPWAIINLALNLGHFSWLTAAHTLIIPIIIPIILRKINKNSLSFKKHGQAFIPFVIAISITVSCFFIWADRGIFIRTRDYLLLSNAPGQMLNKWYYDYTPYASEALKSPIKKQVKSCWIDPKIINVTRIKDTLSAHGWLATADKTKASLVLETSNNQSLNFNHGSRVILSVEVNDFLKSPGQYLKGYSAITDTMSMFRLLCLGGVTIGFPFLLFAMVFLFIGWVCSQFLPPKVSNLMAPFLTVMVSIMILFYLNPREIKPGRKIIEEALNGFSPRTRIEAIRVIINTRSDILNYRENIKRVMQGTLPERYWLANALGLSPGREAIFFLEQLAFDNSINVQCAAIRGLSRKKDNKISNSIFRKKIEGSPNWYVQQKAYGELKFNSLQ